MAVPRLRDLHPFRVLNPKRLSKQATREAATIKGALRHGRVVALDELPEVDFVLCGSVAVNLSGARVGKGGGFSRPRVRDADRGQPDRRAHHCCDDRHPIQIVREHLMMTDHDLPVDLVATPRAVIEVERQYERPRGSSGTTCSPRRSARSRSWNEWATRRWPASGRRSGSAPVPGSGAGPNQPDGADPYGDRDPEWLDIDWRTHLRRRGRHLAFEPHPEARRRPQRSTTSRSGGPAADLRPRARRLLAELAREHPPLRPHRRVIALDLPGFGDSPMPGWEISIPAYGAARRRLLPGARDRPGAQSSATRWAASSPPR